MTSTERSAKPTASAASPRSPQASVSEALPAEKQAPSAVSSTPSPAAATERTSIGLPSSATGAQSAMPRSVTSSCCAARPALVPARVAPIDTTVPVCGIVPGGAPGAERAAGEADDGLARRGVQPEDAEAEARAGIAVRDEAQHLRQRVRRQQRALEEQRREERDHVAGRGDDPGVAAVDPEIVGDVHQDALPAGVAREPERIGVEPVGGGVVHAGRIEDPLPQDLGERLARHLLEHQPEQQVRGVPVVVRGARGIGRGHAARDLQRLGGAERPVRGARRAP